MLAMAQTAQARVLNQLAKGGPLAGIQVAAAAGDPSQLDSDNPAPGAPRALDAAAAARIARMPGVRTVLPIVTAETVVIWQDQAVTPTGVPSDDRVGDELVGVKLDQ